MSANFKPVGMTVADMQRANDAANAGVDVETEKSAEPSKQDQHSFQKYGQTGYCKNCGQYENHKNHSKAEDIVHTPEGGQRVVRNGQVVSHHDEEDAISPEDKIRLNKAKLIANQTAKRNQTGSYAYKKPRNNPYGNNEVPTHSNKTSRSGEDSFSEGFEAGKGAVEKLEPESHDEAAPPKKQIHMPRRSNRTWRKGEWA